MTNEEKQALINHIHGYQQLRTHSNVIIGDDIKDRIYQVALAALTAQPIQLPPLLQPGADGYDDWYMHSSEDGEYMKADDVIAAIRAAGYEVQE